MFDSSGNQVKKKKNSHASIFKVKFGKKAEGSITDSRERTADTLFSDLDSIALAIEGSDLKDNFVPGELYSRHQRKATGDQIRSSKDHFVVYAISIMSGQWSHLCVFAVLQQGASTGVQLWGWCHCWRCQCGSIQVLQKARVPRLVQFLSCHHVERKASCGQWGTPIWKQTSNWLW